MRLRRALLLVAVGGAVVAVATGASAAGQGTLDLTSIAAANPKAPGFTQPNILSPELQEVIWAQGSFKLDGGTAQVPVLRLRRQRAVRPDVRSAARTASTATEAQKTEPDKNTYVVLNGLHGADSSYDYGTHFLYQGHEATASGRRAPRSRGSTSTPTARTARRCSRPRRRPARRCTRSTARRWDPVGAEAALHDREQGHRRRDAASRRRRSTRRRPTIPRRSTTSRT